MRKQICRWLSRPCCDNSPKSAAQYGQIAGIWFCEASDSENDLREEGLVKADLFFTLGLAARDSSEVLGPGLFLRGLISQTAALVAVAYIASDAAFRAVVRLGQEALSVKSMLN